MARSFDTNLSKIALVASYLLVIFFFVLFQELLLLKGLGLRFWISGGLCLAVIIACAAILRDRSLWWSVPLYGLTFACLSVGLSIVLNLIIRGRSSFPPALGAGYTTLGFLLAFRIRTVKNSLFEPRRLSKRTNTRSGTSRTDPTPQAGSLQAMGREFREGTWLGNAQHRASRRKSPWNLLLIMALPLWLGLFFLCVNASQFVAHAFTHGRSLAGDLIWPSSIAPVIGYFLLLIGTIPLAMVLVNYFVYYCVPPARRAMDAEDKAFPGTEYSTQQPILLRLTFVAFPIAFVLAVVAQLFL